MTPCPSCGLAMPPTWRARSADCELTLATRHVRVVAFRAAAEALGMDPGDDTLSDLAGLCATQDDVLAAVREMRDAEEWDRVAAGFRFLRDRAARRRVEGIAVSP